MTNLKNMLSDLSGDKQLKKIKSFDSLSHLVVIGDYKLLLTQSNRLLQLDPNNSELLRYKLLALCGLGRETSDIGFLRKYCWYCSLDSMGFYLLYQAYLESKDYHNAIIAIAYCLSVDPEMEIANEALIHLKEGLGFSAIRLSFLTTDRIGHLICEPESWIRDRKNRNEKNGILNLFVSNVENVDDNQVANKYLYKLLKQHITIVEAPFWHKLFKSRASLLSDEFYEVMPFDLLSAYRKNLSKKLETDYVTLHNIQKSNDVVIKIPENDRELAEKLLVEKGLLLEREVICFHVRDSSYLSGLYPSVDCTYHDYRDMDIRNYKQAVCYLIDLGYTVVRLGAGSNQSLDFKSDFYFDFCCKRDIEYGDFLEVYLLSICHFFISSTSGPQGVAACFDKPILGLNIVPFGLFYPCYSRFVPKYYVKHDGSAVSFKELLDGVYVEDYKGEQLDLLNSYDVDLINKAGISFKENNAEDILEAVVEFEANINNLGEFTELQNKYQQQLPDIREIKYSDIMVSNSFLEKNRELFNL